MSKSPQKNVQNWKNLLKFVPLILIHCITKKNKNISISRNWYLIHLITEIISRAINFNALYVLGVIRPKMFASAARSAPLLHLSNCNQTLTANNCQLRVEFCMSLNYYNRQFFTFRRKRWTKIKKNSSKIFLSASSLLLLRHRRAVASS